MDFPKSTPGVGLVNGQFADENPGTGQIGSLIPAGWGNAVTKEILNVIQAAGIAPSEEDLTQLLKAVQTIAATDSKRSVVCATTGPIALSGLQTIDGVPLTEGARVLVKNQANAAQNWIYVASAGAWQRAQDANESIECVPGHLVPVQNGTVNYGTVWQFQNTSWPTLGTSLLTFAQVQGRTGVSPGTYKSLTVDQFGRVTGGSNPTTLAGFGILDALRVGAASNQRPELYAAAFGGDDASGNGGALVIREAQQVGSSNTSYAYAPRILFNWSGVMAGALGMNATGGLAWNGKKVVLSDSSELTGKADKATTLGGYGILDALRVGVASNQRPELYASAYGGDDGSGNGGALVIREAQQVGSSNTSYAYAPRILFHWSGVTAGALGMSATGGLAWNGKKVVLADSSELSAKADKATTAAGYGITDVFTKNETYNRTDIAYLITQQLPKRSFAVSDFIRIPDVPGGLIFQFGSVQVAPETTIDVTLPLTFNATRGAVATVSIDASTSQGVYSAYARLISPSVIRLTQDVTSYTGAATQYINWFAWGV